MMQGLLSPDERNAIVPNDFLNQASSLVSGEAKGVEVWESLFVPVVVLDVGKKSRV